MRQQNNTADFLLYYFVVDMFIEHITWGFDALQRNKYNGCGFWSSGAVHFRASEINPLEATGFYRWNRHLDDNREHHSS